MKSKRTLESKSCNALTSRFVSRMVCCRRELDLDDDIAPRLRVSRQRRVARGRFLLPRILPRYVRSTSPAPTAIRRYLSIGLAALRDALSPAAPEVPAAALVQRGGEVKLLIGPHVVRVPVVPDALSIAIDGVVPPQLLQRGLLRRRARRAAASAALNDALSPAAPEVPAAALVQHVGEVILLVGPHVVRVLVVPDALPRASDGVVPPQLFHRGLLRVGHLLVVLAARVTVVTALGLLFGGHLLLPPSAI